MVVRYVLLVVEIIIIVAVVAVGGVAELFYRFMS